MRLSKLLFGLLLLAIVAFGHSFGFGGTATIRLSTFPSAAVADNRSTITVTAEVRDLNGRHVPNGTEVVFVANPGEFQESVVKTVDGYARAVYVAGAIPGMVKITASSYAFGATSQIELELVSDRSLLSSANEYIEVVAPQYLMYSMDLRLLGAAGPNKGVYLRYKG